MKKRNILILVLMLVIGFASVSTTLFINGTLNLGFNQSKFDTDVIYTRAETPYGDATIEEGSKDITFNTEKLENVNQESVLEFDVTNKSRDYDASVTINCGLTDEFKSYDEYVTITTDLTSQFELNASETKTGHVTVKMIKAFNEALEKELEFTCKLVATPKERDAQGNEYVPSDTYIDPILNGADPVLTASTQTRSVEKSLIPVTIANDGTVTYANETEEWYNYENKEWANAVILIDSPSKNYKAGNIIKEEDIESYFVWVPRFKYQIFDEGNYTAKAGDEKPAESIAKEIQIEFESKEVEPSTGSTKDSWLTHPAFTNFDVNGLWVGKFETGYKDAKSTQEAEINANDSSKVIIKPNTYSWRNSTVSNMFKTAYNYKRELDSHMMKNTEWGAVAYLSHSKYGINTEVNINNNSSFLTGYSAVDGTDQSNYPGETGSDETKTLPYNTSTGYKASSTGNITGIYDMSGGSWEYVAGYMDGYGVQNNAATPITSGFTSEELNEYMRYFDVYATNTSSTAYNNRILGDATGEMGPFYYYADKDNNKRYHDNWYDNSGYSVNLINPWFNRGGYCSQGILAGQFYSGRDKGVAFAEAGSRLVLSPQ